jgi:Lysyl oxidase
VNALDQVLRSPGRGGLNIGFGALVAIATVSLLAPMQISARPAKRDTERQPAAALTALGSAAHAGAADKHPCSGGNTRLRCPDLIMSAPRELHLDRSTIPGRMLLRATSSVDSRGAGPLELRAHRVGRHETVVYQVIHARRGRAEVFQTNAKLAFKYIPGERYGYGDVGAASYWKLRHAAAFQLWSIGPHGRALTLVRRGPKVDYCLRDLVRTQPSADSPSEAVYPACSQDVGMRRDVLGTSVGWSDVYPYSYPEQWIDVTGLHGRFAYVQIADPDHHLLESDKRDNVSETYIELPSARVLGTRVGVAAP